MSKRAWIGAALSAVLTVIPTVNASASTTKATSGVMNWGNVSVGGSVWRRAPILTYGGTNFFGIWYLQQLLKTHGIDSHWDGTTKSLSLDWFPAYHANSTIQLDGKVVSGAHTVSIGGSDYVDTTIIARALGWPMDYDAKTKTLTIHHNISPMEKGHRVTIGQRQASPLTSKRIASSVTKVSVKQTWGPVQGFRTVPIVQAQGTSFFGIWYLMQLMSHYGYQSEWKQGTVNFDALPQVVSDGNLNVGDNGGPSALVQYKGHWYVPMSTLFLGANISASVDSKGNVIASSQLKAYQPTAGGAGPSSKTFTVDGTIQPSPGESLAGDKVAILGSTGDTTVTDVSNDGHFHTDVTGDSGSVIGVFTKSSGWLGKDVPITVNPASDGTSLTADGVSVTSTEDTSSVSGQIQPGDTQESAQNVQVVLRNDLTHAHILVTTDSSGRFTAKIPAGPYEVWTVGLKGTQVFSGQRFFAQSGSSTMIAKLAPLPTSSTYETGVARVVAASTNVKAQQLLSVGNMFSRIYQYDLRETGITPELPIVVQVYGNTQDYTQHFRDEGYSPADATNYGENSQAVSESPQLMAVNLDGLDSEFGVNVMAHEFTHSLIAAISYNIPDWVNEGVAWHQGIGAQLDISPSSVLKYGLQMDEWADIIAHKHAGDLFPLGKADSLDPKYNVEAQDYYAVEKLIGQFGLQKVIDYIRNIDAKGDSNAFSAEFGMTESQFSSQVDQNLQSAAAKLDKGLQFTVHISLGGPDTLLLSNPKGKTMQYRGVQPGSYTFTCNPDGSVVAPSGLKPGATSSDNADGNWYIGANYGQSQGLFCISNMYDLGFIQNSVVFDANNNMDVGISDGLPFGMQVVDITPLG